MDNDRSVANGFTTGSTAAGYTLASVGVRIVEWPDVSLTVEIWSTTASGAPDSMRHRLTNPSTQQRNAVNIFTAPANTILKAETTYAVVLSGMRTGQAGRIAQSTRRAEDPGGAAGWSIADARFAMRSGGVWSLQTAGEPLVISINPGPAAPPPNRPPTVPSPISDQSATVGSEFSFTFPTTVFADPDGDNLTFSASQADDSALPSWLVFSPASRSFSGTPGMGDVGTLTVKVTATDDDGATAEDSFDIEVFASGVDVSLSVTAASINVVNGRSVDFTVTPDTAPGATFRVRYRLIPAGGNPITQPVANMSEFLDDITPATDSDVVDDPDDGLGRGLGGFLEFAADSTDAQTVRVGLQDAAGSRAATAGKTFSIAITAISGTTPPWVTAPVAAAIPVITIIDSTPTDAPRLQSATVNGATITLIYDQTLDDTSAPSASAYSYVFNGGETYTNAGESVSISGSAVTITLGTKIAPGETVRITYDSSQAVNPVQDEDSNDAASFTGQAVTNLTPSLPTAPVLVSNLGQSRDSELFTVNDDLAQGFTTGSNSLGYTLTSIDVSIYNATPDPLPPRPIIVKLVTGLPAAANDEIATLTNPDPFQPGTNRFTAPANTTLAANTEYFVVFTATGGQGIGHILSLSGDEDPGAATGWSVSDHSYYRNSGTEIAWNRLEYPDGHRFAGEDLAYRIGVNGTASTVAETTAPVLQSAEVDGDTLTLTYSEALDADSVPAASAFSVSVDGTAAALVATSPVTITGSSVTLTLTRAVSARQTVTASYTVPAGTGADRIRDVAGNAAAAFTGEPVINSSPAAPPSSAGRTLVSNTGQPFSSTRGQELAGDNRLAMNFTTGGDADGYMLGSIGVRVFRGAGATVEVQLYSAADGNGRPVALLHSLTGPATITDEAVNFFSAPVGTTLEANTTYAVVISRSSGELQLAETPSTADDSGAADGWSVADRRHFFGAGRGFWDSSTAALLGISVHEAVTGESPQQVAISSTLAAVATRMVAAAVDSIGPRFGSLPSPSLTLAGQQLSFGHSAPAAAVACSGTDDLLGQHRSGSRGSGGGCAPAYASRGLTPGELFGASAFSVTLGAAHGTAGPDAVLWSMWGRGDSGSFAGSPEGVSYDGSSRSIWLGADARADRWVAGLAVSRGTSGTDYSVAEDGGEGRLETELTALWPYGSWTTDSGMSVQGMIGVGAGELSQLNGVTATQNLSLRAGVLGLQWQTRRQSGPALAVRVDASLAQLAAGGDAEQQTDGLKVDSWRLRGGLETSWRHLLDDDTAFEPFAEMAARRDGGDGLEGVGVELAGGLRYTAARLQAELRGRRLASHAEVGVRESGVSATVRLQPMPGGRGLSLSLGPHWGAGTGGAQTLWQDGLPELQGARETRLDAHVSYGFGLDRHGLLTPFAEVGGDSGRLGVRFRAETLPLGAELVSERDRHSARIGLRLRF